MPHKKTVQPLPLEELTLEELLKPRKGLRKRKLLHIINGMWSSEPGIGGVKFEAGGGARTMSLAQKLTGCIYSMTTPTTSARHGTSWAIDWKPFSVHPMWLA